MTDYIIYKDGEIIKEFKNQKTDIEPFKFMLNHQSNSISHALKYEGYSVECKDVKTNFKTYWKP